MKKTGIIASILIVLILLFGCLDTDIAEKSDASDTVEIEQISENDTKEKFDLEDIEIFDEASDTVTEPAGTELIVPSETEYAPETTKTPETTKKEESTKKEETTKKAETTKENSPPLSSTSKTVYRTPSGKRYHLDRDCGGKNSYSVTLDQAKSAGLTPCQKCAQ